MMRGEVWWAADGTSQGRHPVVLLSWDSGEEFRELITVAQVTTRERGVDAEVRLGPADGLPEACVANLDVIVTIQRAHLTQRICRLSGARMRDIERPVHLALGMELPCRIDRPAAE